MIGGNNGNVEVRGGGGGSMSMLGYSAGTEVVEGRGVGGTVKAMMIMHIIKFVMFM